MPIMKDRKLNGNCCRCRKYAKLEGVDYCRQCLCAVIEKRVKKELAGARGNTNRDYHRLAVVCGNKNSLQCAAAVYLAKKLCRPGFDFEIITQENSSQTTKNAAVILTKCADDIAAEFMEKFISPKISPKPPQQLTNAANIFKSITEKELALYADIKNLKYGRIRNDSKKGYLRRKITEFQKKYPGTIEALAKSGNKIKKLTGK